jgi:hypothetical protein
VINSTARTLCRRVGDFDRFSLFAFLWAFLMLEEKSDSLQPAFFSELPLLASAVLVLFVPGSTRLFALFCALQLLNHLESAPHTGNHFFLISAVNLGWLLTFSRDRWRTRHAAPEARADGSAILAELAPTARVLLAVVYVFAAFHKLNAGFLDPATSCFVTAYEKVRVTLPLLPPRFPGVDGAGIYGTLLVEAGLPLFLLFGRTRAPSLLVGFGFHLFLGLRHPSFSGTAYALFLLFLPLDFRRAATERLRSLPIRDWPWWPVAAFALGYALLAYYAPNLWLDPPRPRLHERAWFFLFAGAGVGALVLARSIPLRALSAPQVDPGAGRIPAPGWMLIAALIVNGASPYLGLKTTTSFSMYSNLRTEQISNHLLIPKGALQLFDAQDDLVAILESDDEILKAYASNGERLPLFELQRLVAMRARDSNTPIPLRFAHRGVPREIADARVDPIVGSPPSWIEAKLRHFRAVPPGDESPCRW